MKMGHKLWLFGVLFRARWSGWGKRTAKNCFDHFSPEIIFLAHKKFSIWIYLNVNIFLRAYFRALTCRPIRRCKAHVGSLILILNCTRTSNSAYFYGRTDHSNCKRSQLKPGEWMLRRLFFYGTNQVAFACKLKIYFRNDLNAMWFTWRGASCLPGNNQEFSDVTAKLIKSSGVGLISIDFLRDYISNALSSAN